MLLFFLLKRFVIAEDPLCELGYMNCMYLFLIFALALMHRASFTLHAMKVFESICPSLLFLSNY